MTKIIRIITLLMLLIIIFPSALSCAQTVSQEEYDATINELSETKSQIATLQNKLAEAESMAAQYKELSAKYEELQKPSEVKSGEVETVQAEYEELKTEYEGLQERYDMTIDELVKMRAQYEELKKQYDEITRQPEEITEEDIEQALFELINQERINNGVAELIWGVNLHKVAQRNNRSMAETGKYQYDQTQAIQEIFWAVGYDTVAEIANAALTVWKNNPYQYQNYLLSKVTTYGAIDAYKTEDIIYITYIGATFR